MELQRVSSSACGYNVICLVLGRFAAVSSFVSGVVLTWYVTLGADERADSVEPHLHWVTVSLTSAYLVSLLRLVLVCPLGM